MSLEDEISEARKEIISDGYDMSVGEVINLYKDGDLIISPAYQRLFRWDSSRKTKFVESLLLGIPVPPVFVYQDGSGRWELIDGLQRLSTIFEFVGILKDETGTVRPRLSLEGTFILPSLADKTWSPAHGEGDDENTIGEGEERNFKRARLRVEILKQESDPEAKYELFQRLNTGGLSLSEQEVRNCVAIMVDPTFFQWLTEDLASDNNFLRTISQTKTALEKQSAVELALRFLSFRNVPYIKGLDVHEYLDQSQLELIKDPEFLRDEQKRVFQQTFSVLSDALGENAFKKWDGDRFVGKFLLSVFEVLAVGTAKAIDLLLGLGVDERRDRIIEASKGLWENPTFENNSGAGVRGTTRLTNLIPLAETLFATNGQD